MGRRQGVGGVRTAGAKHGGLAAWDRIVLGLGGRLVAVAVLVALEIAREPRDLRWTLWAAVLVAMAAFTWGRYRGMEGRFLILGEIAAVLLIGSAWGIARARHRTRVVAAWACSHGFEPVALPRRRAEVTLPGPLLRLPLIARMRWPRTRCVVSRRDDLGQHWTVFDVFSPRGRAGVLAGDGPSAMTVVALRRPGGRLPFFQVRPRSLPSSRDGGPVGEEVPISQPPEFASRTRLGGHEARNLAALFDAGVAAEFARHTGWVVEGEGEWLAAAYCDEPGGMKAPGLRVAPPGRWEALVTEASALLAMAAGRADRRSFRDSGAA